MPAGSTIATGRRVTVGSVRMDGSECGPRRWSRQRCGLGEVDQTVVRVGRGGAAAKARWPPVGRPHLPAASTAGSAVTAAPMTAPITYVIDIIVMINRLGPECHLPKNCRRPSSSRSRPRLWTFRVRSPPNWRGTLATSMRLWWTTATTPPPGPIPRSTWSGRPPPSFSLPNPGSQLAKHGCTIINPLERAKWNIVRTTIRCEKGSVQ